MSFDKTAFCEALYDAGWRSPNDAQWENIDKVISQFLLHPSACELTNAQQRIRELEEERDAAIEEATELRGALHDHQQMADEVAKRESLLVAEVWRCWGLARQTIDDRFLLDMILDNRPAEVRAIVEGKK